MPKETTEMQAAEKRLIVTRRQLAEMFNRLDDLAHQMAVARTRIEQSKRRCQALQAERLERLHRKGRIDEMSTAANEGRDRHSLSIDEDEAELKLLCFEFRRCQMDANAARKAFEAARARYTRLHDETAFDEALQAALKLGGGAKVIDAWQAAKRIVSRDLPPEDCGARNVAARAGRLLGEHLDAAARCEPLNLRPEASRVPRHRHELDASIARSVAQMKKLRQGLDAERADLVA